jgi:hypothetical protein
VGLEDGQGIEPTAQIHSRFRFAIIAKSSNNSAVQYGPRFATLLQIVERNQRSDKSHPFRQLWRQVTNVRIEREPLSGRSRNRMLTGRYALGSWQIDDQIGQSPEPRNPRRI